MLIYFHALQYYVDRCKETSNKFFLTKFFAFLYFIEKRNWHKRADIKQGLTDLFKSYL